MKYHFSDFSRNVAAIIEISLKVNSDKYTFQ